MTDPPLLSYMTDPPLLSYMTDPPLLSYMTDLVKVEEGSFGICGDGGEEDDGREVVFDRGRGEHFPHPELQVYFRL